MATLTLADIANALSTRMAAPLDRQFNRTSVGLSLVKKVDGQGKQINWDARFSRSTHAAAFTEGSSVQASEFNVDPTVPASLPWGMYRVAFSLSGIAVAAAANSQGSALELLDQFESNLIDAASDLASQLNAGLYSGTGLSNNMHGLIGGGAILATGLYANINRTTFTEWAGNVSTNSNVTRPLTKGLMDTMETTIYKKCGKTPRVIIADPDVTRKYESLFDSVARVMVERGDLSAISQTATAGTPWIPDNSGFTGLHYKEIPIYRDKDLGAAYPGSMLFLHPDYWELPTMPQVALGNVVLTRAQAAPAAAQPEPGGANAAAGINFKVESLAKDGDADKFQLVVYVNQKVRKPNHFGYLGDLDVT